MWAFCLAVPTVVQLVSWKVEKMVVQWDDWLAQRTVDLKADKTVGQMVVVMAENSVFVTVAWLVNLWAVQLVVKMDYTMVVTWAEPTAEKMELMMAVRRDTMKEFLMVAWKEFRMVALMVEQMVVLTVVQMGDYSVESFADASGAHLVEKTAEKLGIQTAGLLDQRMAVKLDML